MEHKMNADRHYVKNRWDLSRLNSGSWTIFAETGHGWYVEELMSRISYSQDSLEGGWHSS